MEAPELTTDTAGTDDPSSMPASEEHAVDIHKPKPVHSMREFFSEIGVIVVGIAIALTGEQLVERWHWSQQTHETEAALRSEIQESVDNVSERFAVDTCLRRQLSLLQTAATNKTPLAKPISVDPLRVAPDLYASPWRAWTRGSWEAAVASNGLGHMSQGRLHAYANAYKAIEDIDETIGRERAAKGALAPLIDSALDRQQANEASVAITNLDRNRADILIAGRDLLGYARDLGLAPRRQARNSGSSFSSSVAACR